MMRLVTDKEVKDDDT